MDVLSPISDSLHLMQHYTAQCSIKDSIFDLACIAMIRCFRYSFYSWFKQFEGSLNRDLAILQLPLGDLLNIP
jgi:hypothetical protein